MTGGGSTSRRQRRPETGKKSRSSCEGPDALAYALCPAPAASRGHGPPGPNQQLPILHAHSAGMLALVYGSFCELCPNSGCGALLLSKFKRFHFLQYKNTFYYYTVGNNKQKLWHVSSFFKKVLKFPPILVYIIL